MGKTLKVLGSIVTVLIVVVGLFSDTAGVLQFFGISYTASKSIETAISLNPKPVYYDIETWPENQNAQLKILIESVAQVAQIGDDVKIDSIAVIDSSYLSYDFEHEHRVVIESKDISSNLLTPKKDYVTALLTLKLHLIFNGHNIAWIKQSEKIHLLNIFVSIPITAAGQTERYSTTVPFFIINSTGLK